MPQRGRQIGFVILTYCHHPGSVKRTDSFYQPPDSASAQFWIPLLSGSFIATCACQVVRRTSRVDMATLGACLAMLLTAGLNWRWQRDFAREWAESLRVKDPRPLGEDALRRRVRGSS